MLQYTCSDVNRQSVGLKLCLLIAREIPFAKRYFVSLMYVRNFELFPENFVSLKVFLKKKKTLGMQNFSPVNQLYTVSEWLFEQYNMLPTSGKQ